MKDASKLPALIGTEQIVPNFFCFLGTSLLQTTLVFKSEVFFKVVRIFFAKGSFMVLSREVMVKSSGCVRFAVPIQEINFT